MGFGQIIIIVIFYLLHIYIVTINIRGKIIIGDGSIDNIIIRIFYLINIYLTYHIINVYYHDIYYALRYETFTKALYDSLFFFYFDFSLKHVATLLISAIIYIPLFKIISGIIGHNLLRHDEEILSLKKTIADLQYSLNEANEKLSDLEDGLDLDEQLRKLHI